MNRSPRKRLGVSLGSMLTLVALIIGGIALPAPATAQDGAPHPAHIHVGDCSAPGEVVGSLDNLEYNGATGLSWSRTAVDLSLDEILATPHAIVVHESEANIGNYVLCGNIGGVNAMGMLTITLSELNNSGMEGVAILDAADQQTDVDLFALDDAAVTGMAMPGATDKHPAHIHTGSCPNPGEVEFPLTDVAPLTGDMTGSEASAPEQSGTAIHSTLAVLTSEPRAIVAHLSADEIGTYLVCGDIVGEPRDNRLPVPLYEVNGSGYVGVALLEDNNGKVDVWLFLMPGIGGSMGGGMATPAMEGMDHSGMATPEASPEIGAQSGDVAATIVDFAYQPGTIEIAVGTTVTWTNEDTAPHTVTGNGGAFQSGRMDQGDTFSFTFDEPGTYEYYCEFHPNMTATVVVR